MDRSESLMTWDGIVNLMANPLFQRQSNISLPLTKHLIMFDCFLWESPRTFKWRLQPGADILQPWRKFFSVSFCGYKSERRAHRSTVLMWAIWSIINFLLFARYHMTTKSFLKIHWVISFSRWERLKTSGFILRPITPTTKIQFVSIKTKDEKRKKIDKDFFVVIAWDSVYSC